MKQYELCKEVGLKPTMINGKTALVQKIDLNYVDEFGRTNFERMLQEIPALDSDGLPYELHHVGQQMDSTLAILTKAQHTQGGNSGIWHVVKASEIDRNVFAIQRAAFWKSLAELIAAGGV